MLGEVVESLTDCGSMSDGRQKQQVTLKSVAVAVVETRYTVDNVKWGVIQLSQHNNSKMRYIDKATPTSQMDTHIHISNKYAWLITLQPSITSNNAFNFAIE